MHVFIHFSEQPSPGLDPDATGPREVLFNLSHARRIQTVSGPGQADVLQLMNENGFPLASPRVVGGDDFLATAHAMARSRPHNDTPLVFPFHHPTPAMAMAPASHVFEQMASLSPAVMIMMRREQGAGVTEVFHGLCPVPTYSRLSLDAIAYRLSRAGHAVLTLPQP